MTDLHGADPASLLPPNATRLERAIEVLTQRIDAIPVPLRDLISVEACPDVFLPWLAFTRSVDAWNPAWSPSVKRNLIAASIEVHRRKGSAKSVRDVIAAFGGQIALREWFDHQPPRDPYTFDLVLTLNGADGAPATGQFVQEVIDEVERTKPVRSRFTLTQGLSTSGSVTLAGAARVSAYQRIVLTEDTDDVLAPLMIRAAGAYDISDPALATAFAWGGVELMFVPGHYRIGLSGDVSLRTELIVDRGRQLYGLSGPFATTDFALRGVELIFDRSRYRSCLIGDGIALLEKLILRGRTLYGLTSRSDAEAFAVVGVELLFADGEYRVGLTEI
ncbi:phage tail P2-like protein [Brevundimonas bullata]|uniref:Phage tail P2-like protein n=1 Tax=Brevundimonas bullata TaxID=13160 RepID=A0A7W7N2Q5_9CAUL|nr:phage tail protein I [Brevundimonas bullata]MBB4797583.1 phage tail P2-like protein [Brevundimonas bullata]MBB6382543.1 phage tail P2-like protein [Brevundimonas bullata]